MNWFNYVGLIFIFIIMVPNIIFGIVNKNGFNNTYKNKVIEQLEQVGRFGCFGLMIFNIPYTYFNFWFKGALYVYIIVGSVLVIIYCIGWIVCWNKYLLFRAYILSIIPSILFLFCGVMLLYMPLIFFSVIFSIFHITISLKNAYGSENKI